MEPNNTERQFREKLNAREIQPSAQAWDRLDAMLSVAEEKKTKRSFGWLYIAASILVLVSLGLFLFNPKNTEIQPQNEVVDTEIKKDSVENSSATIQTPVAPAQLEKQVAVSEEPLKNQEAPISNHHRQTNNQGVAIINQKENANQNQIIKDKAIEFQNSSDVALKDLPKTIDTKEPIVVKTAPVSDAALLASLDNAAKQSASGKSGTKVSAKSLLSQVDGEVEYTFREKTFNKLNKNYQEIKVALANRNNK